MKELKPAFGGEKNFIFCFRIFEIAFGDLEVILSIVLKRLV